jgi:hypothetical protein
MHAGNHDEASRSRVRVLDRSEKPSRQQDDSSYQLQDAIDRDTHDPEWQQEEPDQWIEHESRQRKGPAEDEENAPEQKFNHRYSIPRPPEQFI